MHSSHLPSITLCNNVYFSYHMCNCSCCCYVHNASFFLLSLYTRYGKLMFPPFSYLSLYLLYCNTVTFLVVGLIKEYCISSHLMWSGGSTARVQEATHKRRALHSVAVKHGCHPGGRFFLPEENLGEQISWSRRIIPRLVSRRLHAPRQWEQTWRLPPQADSHAGIDNTQGNTEASCCQLLKPGLSHLQTCRTGSMLRETLSQVSGETARPRPPLHDWLTGLSIISAPRALVGVRS